MATSPRSGRLLTILLLLGITLMGGAIRFTVMERAFPLQLVGDENYYTEVAVNIAQGRGHVLQGTTWALRPPVQPFLFSLAIDERATRGGTLDEGSLERLLVLQVSLGTLLVFLTGLLGWRLFGPRVSVVSALLAALYPTLVAYSHYLWAEPLYSVLISGALLLALRLRSRAAGARAAVLAGLVFGVATLTREIAIPTALAVALWLLLQAPRAYRARTAMHCGIMLLATALVVLPWTWRNHRVFQRFVPISTLGWFAVYEGNSFADEDWIIPDLKLLRPFRNEYFAINDEIERMEFARERALAQLGDAWPTLLWKKAVRTATLLMTPDSFLFKKVSRGAYGPVDPATFRPVLVATVLSYVLIASAAILGIAAAGDGGRRSLACLLLGMAALLYFTTASSSRYRVPWLPLLIPYAAHALCTTRDLARRAGPRLWLACGMLALLLCWCLPFFWPDALSLWQHGTYRNPLRP